MDVAAHFPQGPPLFPLFFKPLIKGRESVNPVGEGIVRVIDRSKQSVKSAHLSAIKETGKGREGGRVSSDRIFDKSKKMPSLLDHEKLTLRLISAF